MFRHHLETITQELIDGHQNSQTESWITGGFYHLPTKLRPLYPWLWGISCFLPELQHSWAWHPSERGQFPKVSSGCSMGFAGRLSASCSSLIYCWLFRNPAGQRVEVGSLSHPVSQALKMARETSRQQAVLFSKTWETWELTASTIWNGQRFKRMIVSDHPSTSSHQTEWPGMSSQAAIQNSWWSLQCWWSPAYAEGERGLFEDYKNFRVDGFCWKSKNTWKEMVSFVKFWTSSSPKTPGNWYK